MPLRWLFVISALVLSAGCSPGRFAWHEEEPAMERYRAAFTAAAGDRLVDSTTLARFVEMAAATRVLWLGDHHRDMALHGLQLALLQQLHERGVRCCLGLEAIGIDDQPAVSAFLAGRGA